jgi:hypothetical protein
LDLNKKIRQMVKNTSRFMPAAGKIKKSKNEIGEERSRK